MDARLQLGHGGLATTHSGIIGVLEPVVQLTERSLQSSLGLAECGGVILLSTELVSQTGGVNHRLLGLLLGALGLVQQVVNLGLHGVQSSLHTSLVRVCSGVDGSHLVHSRAGVGQLGLSLSLATLSRVQQSSGLLNLPGQGVGPAVSQAGSLGHLLAAPAGLLVLSLRLAQLALVALDGLQGLVVGLVGVVQGDLELVDFSLQLLLDPQTLGLGALLGVEGGLERLHGATVVLTGVVELLLLLGNPAVNLLLHLPQLQLGAEHLVLLGLQGALGLLQSGLQLLLLSLKSAALFVKLVDGAASISQLVEEVLHLVSQVLVLAADNVQLLVGLVQGGLQAEPLSVEVAALRVAGIELSHQVVSLGLPLSNNLVEVTAALLGDHGGGVGPLVLHANLLQLGVHPGLGLLGGGDLGVEGINVLLSLLDTRGQLVSASLQLVNAAESLNFVLGLPQLDLSLGLGQSLQGVVLLLVLLVNAHAQVLRLSHQVLVLGQQGGAVPGLSVSEPLGVLQLGGQRDLVLLQSSDGVLGLLDLTVEVLGLHLQLLLGAVGLVKGAGHLVQLLVGLDNEPLGHLAVLLHVGPLSHALLQSRPGLLQVPLHAGLVLLTLGLVLVDGVDLLAQLGHAVVVLLSQSSQGALVTDVGLLQVGLQLGQLALALLVELNLEGGVGPGLLQPGADVLQVPGQEAAVLLGLAAVAALHVDLLVKLVHTDLELLDLLAVLAAQRLLVLDLGSNAGDLLLPALDGLAELRDGSLQVGHGLLGQLQVSLDLALHLLSVTLGLLLPLQGILALVQGLLQLALHLAQVVAPVLHGLDVLLSLLPALSGGLLVLAQLGDEILLVGDLVTESPDLTVLGALVVLALLNGGLQLLDLLPQTDGFSGHLGAGLLDTVDGVVLSLDAGVGLVHLLLQVVPGVLQAGGFVDDLLDSGAAGLESQDQLVLLSGELGVDISHGGALGDGLVDVGLGNGDLVLVLLLE